MVDPDTGALVLVRARQGMCSETRRVVHLALVPSSPEVSGPLVALSGALLVAGEVEPVASGAGVPCSIACSARTASWSAVAVCDDVIRCGAGR